MKILVTYQADFPLATKYQKHEKKLDSMGLQEGVQFSELKAIVFENSLKP